MILEWIAKHHINEYSDVLGLLISVLGFSATLWNVWRSRIIATQALEVANTVRDDLRKLETVADISSAVGEMEELKRLHRKNEMDPLPERYSSLRRLLVGIRAGNQILTQQEQAIFQATITQLAGFERQIEKALMGGDPAKVDFVKINRIISKSIDEIHAVVIRLKTAIGDGK